MQSTGEILQDGEHQTFGYAGNGLGKNNPAMQDVHNIGPIPVGKYTMEAPVDTDTHGPYVLWLVPDPTNNMFGRSAFGIHGDSLTSPGNASEGCIVTARLNREAIWESGDHEIEVVA